MALEIALISEKIGPCMLLILILGDLILQAGGKSLFASRTDGGVVGEEDPSELLGTSLICLYP